MHALIFMCIFAPCLYVIGKRIEYHKQQLEPTIHMKKLTTLILMSAALLAVWSCQRESEIVEYFEKPTDVVNPNPPLPPVDFTKASLGELAEKQGIKLGTAITHSEYFQNDQVAEILTREFNSVTIGNEMKHDAIVQTNGKLKFDTADEMAGWIKDAGADLYGHTLGWHSQQQTTYLNALIDKASADNSASLLQDNWNFEKGSLDGFTAQNVEITADYLDVFAGESAAKAVSDGALLSFDVPVAEGTPYIVSFWAKAPSGGTLTLRSGDGLSAATDVADSWTKYSATFTTKSAASPAYTLTLSQGVCVDNIRVIETEPEPESDGGGAGSYINPYAIDGGIDFESFTAGTTAQQLLEAGFAQINGPDYVYVTDEQSNSGSLSLKMDNGDGHAGNSWDIQVITPSYDITPGVTYRIAWYSMANVEANLQIDIRLASGTQYKNSAWGNYPMTGTSWTYQTYDFTAAEGDDAVQVAFYGATEAATYYLDDFQIFEAVKEGDYTNYVDKTNLLAAADFETDGVWGVWNGPDYASFVNRNEPEIGANADKVHSGLRSLVVDNNGTGWTGGSAWHIQVANNNKVVVTAGESYRFAMWVKSPDGAETIQFELRYSDGTTGYKQLTGIGENWTYIYGDYEMPEGVDEVQIVLDCAYNEATYYIDDVQFFPTPVETCIDPASVADDGDFEAYSDADALKNAGWQVNGADHVSLVADSHHGSKAVRMDNSDGFAGNSWDIQLVSKTYDIEPGKTYRIAWQAKADEADVDMQIDIRLASGTQYKNSAWGNYDKMGTDWTYQFYDVEAADGDDNIRVAFYGGGSTNVITLDCLQIFPIESAAAVIKATRGFGSYGNGWQRPAPAPARAAKAPEFESTAKLDGELAADAIAFAYKTFVYGMVAHFDAYAWDVVNETFTDDGNYRTVENTTDGFIWGSWFGSTRNWVDKAFAYAADAASRNGKSPVLYINDYNLETSAAKRKAFCDYAKENSQVTGVGTQMHLDMSTSDLETKIEESLKDLAATGKMVRISELDIKCTDEDAQAELYKYIFAKYIEVVPLAQRGGITFWGINDKDSWVGESNAPLLWKGNKYTRKAAYEALYVYLCELAGIDPYEDQ